MRNPSPPPLDKEEATLLRGDCIGDTIFSKKWILTTLMKIYKHDINVVYILPDTVDIENIPADDILELRKDFESEICDLWDMCSNEEVAIYVNENDCLNIFYDVLKRTYSPRLMEIIFGIIGNLVCFDEIRLSCNEDDLFRETMVTYLCVTDAPSLIELTRILISCLNGSSGTIDIWSKQIEFSLLSNVIDNSLNSALLGNVLEIIDILFDSVDSILEESISEKLIDSLIACLLIIEKSNIKTWTHVVQLISTKNKGGSTLSENKLILEKLKYCVSHVDVFECIQNIDVLVSVMSIVTVLLSNDISKVMLYLDQNIFVVTLFVQSLHCISTDNELLTRYNIYLQFYVDFFNIILTKLSDWLKADHVTSDYDNIKRQIQTIDVLDIKAILKYCDKHDDVGCEKKILVQSTNNLKSVYELVFHDCIK